MINVKCIRMNWKNMIKNETMTKEADPIGESPCGHFSSKCRKNAAQKGKREKSPLEINAKRKRFRRPKIKQRMKTANKELKIMHNEHINS